MVFQWSLQVNMTVHSARAHSVSLTWADYFSSESVVKKSDLVYVDLLPRHKKHMGSGNFCCYEMTKAIFLLRGQLSEVVFNPRNHSIKIPEPTSNLHNNLFFSLSAVLLWYSLWSPVRSSGLITQEVWMHPTNIHLRMSLLKSPWRLHWLPQRHWETTGLIHPGCLDSSC